MDEDDLSTYYRSIRGSQPLSRKEEAELAVRIRNGDESALEKLVGSNLKFVVTVAKKYQNQGLKLQELITEGNLGLVKAAERFDEGKGVKFISYAVWWIRQAIQEALRKNRDVNRPSNRIVDASKISKAYDRLSNLLGRGPTDEELAEKLHMDVDDVNKAYLATRPELSFDAPLDGSDKRTLHDLISREDGDVIESLERADLIDYVERMLEVLNKREYFIVQKYFGLDGEKPMTLEEIGNGLGLTRERIRQLRDRAFGKIRSEYQAEIVNDEITY